MPTLDADTAALVAGEIGGAPDDVTLANALVQRVFDALGGARRVLVGGGRSHPDFFVLRIAPSTPCVLDATLLDDLHRLNHRVLTIRLVAMRGHVCINVAHAARAHACPKVLFTPPEAGARARRRHAATVISDTDWTGIRHMDDIRTLAALMAAVANMQEDMPVLERWVECIGSRGKTVKASATSAAVTVSDDDDDDSDTTGTVSAATEDDVVGYALAFHPMPDVHSPFLKHIREDNPTLVQCYVWNAPPFADKLSLLVLNVRRFAVTPSSGVLSALARHRVRGYAELGAGKKRKAE